MKAVYLRNFRKGNATNSSSTHSVIYRNKGEMFEDLNIFSLDYYDRFDNTIAATRSAKIKYIAANIMYEDKLFEIVSAIYPEMRKYSEIIKKAKESEHFSFGMSRGELFWEESKNLELTLDYIRHIIDDEDVIIVGGSDERDWVYDVTEGHEHLIEPISFSDKSSITKNGNYWMGVGYDGRIRFSFDRKQELIPSYAELIDLKITNQCNNGCPFCYMDSNSKGKHADIEFLKKFVTNVSPSRGRYEHIVEFSIGGGNVLLYPHIVELFNFIVSKGHIVNTTIKASDCMTILESETFRELFKDVVTGIGISVSDEKDIEYLKKFKDFKSYKCVIHLIPEILGVERTRSIMAEGKKLGYYSYLFLGYKNIGRGKTQEHKKFTEEEIKALFKDECCISIDTSFANSYSQWIEDDYELEHTLTKMEGEFSMYVDGVNQTAYKSSYNLEKPYKLYDFYKKDGVTTWIDAQEAFEKIRQDNGLKIYRFDD